MGTTSPDGCGNPVIEAGNDAIGLSVVTLISWSFVAVLGFATLAGFFGRYWWVLDLASHFRLQYLGILSLAVILAMGFRRFRTALITAILAAVNLCLVSPFYITAPVGPTEGSPLRVMWINVHAANRQVQLVRGIIESEAPDLVFLLEFNERWRRQLQGLDADFPYSRQVPQPGNFGMALYSRRPLRGLDVVEVGQIKLPGIIAEIDVGGDSCTIIGVHTLPPMSQWAAQQRNDQFTHVAKMARQCNGPCIVLGDLNCTSWSPFFQRLLRDGGLRDSRLGWGVQCTWPTQWPLMMIPIDHCLVSDEVVVCNRYVKGNVGSDHRAVVVDLDLRARHSKVRGYWPDTDLRAQHQALRSREDESGEAWRAILCGFESELSLLSGFQPVSLLRR
jgi:endonuclease/exonuclease/phosphatase (EEP) superfamily protein YafD